MTVKRGKNGRIELTKKQRDMMIDMASVACTTADIATVLEISADTIERRYMDVLEKGRAAMRSSLRSRQYRLAMDGNPTMLIWLGKQELNQRDIVETKGDLVHHFVSGVPQDLSEEDWEAQYGAPEDGANDGGDGKVH